MIRFIHLLLVLLVTSSCFATKPSSMAGNTPSENRLFGTRKVRILFIGNSAIYFHNLPDIVKSIAASGPNPIDVDCELIAEGGQTLEGHWLEGRAQREIRAKHWDYVVLQEQSGLNDELEVNGQWLIAGWESYHRFAKLFDAEAKAVGAKTVILALWSHKGMPPREQQVLDYGSQSLAREIGAILVPAGSAWHALEARAPNLTLYFDGFHPTPTASYMFAVTFYATVFHRNPAGLAERAFGTNIDLDDHAGANPNELLVDVPKETASEIKQVAYNVVRHGAREVNMPADPILPALQAGSPVTKENLVGSWRGTEALVSSNAAPLNIDISSEGDDLLANTHFALQNPIDEKALKGGIDGNVIWFVNPKGISGGYVRYRAVLVGDKLVGIVEVWLQNKLTAIGTFEASRKT
jgi:hypothetical protein